MSNKIWVYVDHFKGNAHPGSWEAISAARELAASLGGGVTAVVLGDQVEGLAQSAFHYGAEEVLLADDATLQEFRSQPYAEIFSHHAKASSPDVILFPSSTRGRELAGMVAMDLDSGVLPDVTALEMRDGQILGIRPVYAGKVIAETVCESRPQIITLRTRAFTKGEADETRSGVLNRVDALLTEDQIPLKVKGYSEEDGGTVSLTDASTIVSGGRGVSNNPNLSIPADISDEKEQEIFRAQEGFKLVIDLAQVLGAAVGASRAAVDAGYIPYAYQVGQTGKVVSPDLYIACGISGAIQHQAGMRTSKIIVAINKDSDAPIFKLSRYGVVGDLWQILPPLTKAFQKHLGE